MTQYEKLYIEINCLRQKTNPNRNDWLCKIIKGKNPYFVFYFII